MILLFQQCQVNYLEYFMIINYVILLHNQSVKQYNQKLFILNKTMNNYKKSWKNNGYIFKEMNIHHTILGEAHLAVDLIVTLIHHKHHPAQELL